MSKFTDKTGIEIRGLLCIKELGHSRVLLKCVECGRTQERDKKAWIKGGSICKFCGVKSSCKNVVVVGEEKNNLICTEVLKGGLVRVKCKACGKVQQKFRTNWLKGSVSCVACKAHVGVGDIYDGFKCIEEIEYNIVKLKCEKCGSIEVRRKNIWIKGQVACDNCGIPTNHYNRIVGHVICNITVLKYVYTGRNGIPYYLCRSNVTGKEIGYPLSYNDLFLFT